MAGNYLMLIIYGWINNNEYLENYFYREFKKAQKEEIPPDEFALHLSKEVARIDSVRLEPYYRELEAWNDYYIQETRKGNKIDIKTPDNADGYSTPLLNLTNGKYVGHIGKSDLEYIKDCIDKAFEKIKNENKPVRREISKLFEDWLNMSTEKKYDDALAEYNKKFPKGSIEDFHLLEREHLLERIDSYKKLVNPDAFEIKTKIEREKLLKYIDGLDKKVLLQQKETEQQNPKISAPSIRLFCSIVHQAEILIKGFDESSESYIEKVCKKFNIEANPKKARQYFNPELDIKKTDKNLKRVIELILPNIPGETKNKIETFINNKTKMYG
jgi:hypothetical protein